MNEDIKALITQVRDELITQVRAVRDELRADNARLEAKIDRVDAKIDAHRLETAKGFADVDAELSRHADPLHKRMEAEIVALRKDVDALKARRAPRATTARRR